MGHGIRDQLLQLVDEVEKLTTEVFEAVQEGNQAENLLELLMKKDQQLTESLRIADIQLQLHQQITECNAQIELYNGRISRYQKKLSEASDSLLPALSQAKKRLKIIQEAEDKKILAEDIVKYSHKLCASHSNIAPTGWLPGDPRRPYPTEHDMRAGILHHLAQGNISIHPDQAKPLPQLGTDGLRTLIDSKSDPNNPGLGATWVRGESSASQRNQQIPPGVNIKPSGYQQQDSSSDSSSDSSFGD